MKKYVALLRGINVGGNSKVSMKELKKAFESLNFKNVSTYINSGNVIFEEATRGSESIVDEVEKKLKKVFGFPIMIMLRDAKNIQKLAGVIPSEWTNDTTMKTDVLFLSDEFDKKDTLKLITTNTTVDTLLYHSGAIVWKVDRSNYTKSGMRKFIGTTVYKNMTARNINTLRKLAVIMK